MLNGLLLSWEMRGMLRVEALPCPAAVEPLAGMWMYEWPLP